MANDDLLTAAISDLPPKYDCNEETRENLRKIALSPRFIFINLDELRYINDSDYPFDFSGDEVEVQKILLYLFSCDFYAMYCDKFFRTIETSIQHKLFQWWHMKNNLSHNMVANYIRYVISSKDITDYACLDGPPFDPDSDDEYEYDPRFMPASTQYYILYSPFQQRATYVTHRLGGYHDLCYNDIYQIEGFVGYLESETIRIFASRHTVVEKQIYYAVYNSWRIAVDDNVKLIERIQHTSLTNSSEIRYRSPTAYLDPELPLPKYHTNNWWLNLHNFTLTVDDMIASRDSITVFVAFDYIGAFLHAHRKDFDNYHALSETALAFISDWLNDKKNQRDSMLYVNADPQYYLDFYNNPDMHFPDHLTKAMFLLRYLIVSAYQRTITVKDLESYYLYLPAILRQHFVNELFTLPVCDFNLFYPFVVDACPLNGDAVGLPYVRQMSFSKTLIKYRTSRGDSHQASKLNRTSEKNYSSSFVGCIDLSSPYEPVQMSSTLYPRSIKGDDESCDEAPIILDVDTSMFATNPCGFEDIRAMIKGTWLI